MKTKKRIQAAAYILTVVTVFAVLMWTMILILAALMPVLGSLPALVLAFIVCVALGGLWGYLSIMGIFWLVERGWFV